MQDTRATHRPRAGVFSAAAAVVLLAAGGIVYATRGPEATPPTSSRPITPGGMASCVEQYSLSSLRDREVAFAGTVKSVNGDSITFGIDDLFKGSVGGEITLAGASTLGGITSAGSGVSLDPGTRLLVAGDGGFAWSCGFTQTYDADVASDWRAALD